MYYDKVVKQNHGIRQEDVANLARPLGVLPELEATCEDLFNSAKALSSARGRVAHVATVAVELRPKVARALVLNVIKDMGPFAATLTFGRTDAGSGHSAG